MAGDMITTGEARRIAEAWLREEAYRIPELVGVILGGSTKARDPEVPQPAASDVDILLWVDAEVPSNIEHPRGRFAPRKFLRDGVILEPSFHDVQHIADPEAVLGDVHLAAAFADPLLRLAGSVSLSRAAVSPNSLSRVSKQSKPEVAAAWRSSPFTRVPQPRSVAVSAGMPNSASTPFSCRGMFTSSSHMR